MQTFLPFSDFRRCAKVLDNKRLNKQIVEAYQIYSDRVPNINHPACLIWACRKPYLRIYILIMCEEYEARFGRKHAISLAVKEPCTEWHVLFQVDQLTELSHCVNLIRKGVSVDILTQHLSTLTKRLYGVVNVPIDEFPLGYYWQGGAVGKKAITDTENWVRFDITKRAEKS